MEPHESPRLGPFLTGPSMCSSLLGARRDPRRAEAAIAGPEARHALACATGFGRAKSLRSGQTLSSCSSSSSSSSSS
eukprot:5706706-Pyramimonas_sp.AAC.1